MRISSKGGVGIRHGVLRLSRGRLAMVMMLGYGRFKSRRRMMFWQRELNGGLRLALVFGLDIRVFIYFPCLIPGILAQLTISQPTNQSGKTYKTYKLATFARSTIRH